MSGGVFRFEFVNDSTSAWVLAALTSGSLAIVMNVDPGEDEISVETSTKLADGILHVSLMIPDFLIVCCTITNGQFLDMLINGTFNSTSGRVLCSGNCGELLLVDINAGCFTKISEWHAHCLPYSTGSN